VLRRFADLGAPEAPTPTLRTPSIAPGVRHGKPSGGNPSRRDGDADADGHARRAVMSRNDAR